MFAMALVIARCGDGETKMNGFFAVGGLDGPDKLVSVTGIVAILK